MYETRPSPILCLGKYPKAIYASSNCPRVPGRLLQLYYSSQILTRDLSNANKKVYVCIQEKVHVLNDAFVALVLSEV